MKKRSQFIIISYRMVRFCLDCLVLPFLLLAAIFGRLIPKRYDVGIGPFPIISHPYHKKALELYGYKVQTFVDKVYFITDKFDIRYDGIFRGSLWIFLHYFLFAKVIFSYRCIYMYFSGGPLHATSFLWKLEPFLLKLAGLKTVLMPYGSDIQDMSKSPNLLFKHAMSLDYPASKYRRTQVIARTEMWTAWADHIISGCEWVDYMSHWDTLMLSHFAINTDVWKPDEAEKTDSATLKILHAPNHRNIKGSNFFIKAVEELKAEGENIELVMLEKVPNEKIKEAISAVDIVADQLIIGWYAMFAIEAMAMGKPVLCYIREDLEKLYIAAGLIQDNELPLVKCDTINVKEKLKELIKNKELIRIIGCKSRKYVVKYHSLSVIGLVFSSINQKIGVKQNKSDGNGED